MVFTKDELHCDIFALVLIIQRLLGHASWQTFLKYYFFIHCRCCSVTLCLLCLEILESNSTYVSSMDF